MVPLSHHLAIQKPLFGRQSSPTAGYSYSTANKNYESMVGSIVAKRATVIRFQQRVFAMCLETKDLKATVAKAMTTGAVSESEIVEVEGAYCCAERVMKVKDPYGFVWQFYSPSNKCGANMEA